jgi:hypothetical protein
LKQKLIPPDNIREKIEINGATMFGTVRWLAIDAADLAQTLHSFHLIYKQELPSFAERRHVVEVGVRNVKNVRHN